MQKLTIVLIILCLASGGLSEDADLFSVSTAPDVLLIFDTSGSMTLDMNGNYTWGDGSDYFPGRDTNGDGFTNDSRMYILKRAIYEVVAKHLGIRFGLMSYGQYSKSSEPSRGAPDGGGWYRSSPYAIANTQNIWWHGVDGSGNDHWPKSYPDKSHQILIMPMGLAGDAAHIGAIQQWCDGAQQAVELRADGGTPIGGSLYWARQYYTQELIPKDPAKRCRAYFVLLLSDGEENGYPTSNPYSPYNEAIRLRDIQIMGIKYEVKTFVCGIGVTGGAGLACLDSIAKLGGTEHYYPATTPEELDTALSRILHIVDERATSFSGPEVPSVRTEYYNNMYIASFKPSGTHPFWQGFLKAYRLNPDGTLPQDSLGHVLSDSLWEAGLELKNKLSSSRNIYTQKGGIRVAFTSTYIDSNDLGVASDSVEPLISYIRGDNGYDWKLGDIFHSWPVCVGPPSPWYIDEGYDGFKEIYKHRNKIVLDGANDGMLHAFQAGTYVVSGDSFTAGTGEEIWAFIPNNLLSKFKYIKGTHDYYVDANPVAFDVWFRSSSSDTTKDPSEWKTMVVCGERGGGDKYFALDITDTYNPVFKWEVGGSTMFGETWSNPAIGRVVGKTGSPWKREKNIIVVGGGYNKAAGTLGRAIYVLAATDGSLIRKFTDANMTYCIPSDPILVDRNNDGYVDYIYVGDISGQLWKCDLSTEVSPGSWPLYRIFKSSYEQPFYFAPTAAFDESGQLWIFIGGGDRDSVRATKTNNRMYAIRDNGQTTPYSDGDLSNITSGGTANEKGWYYDLGINEKCVSKPLVFNELVYFTSYEPMKATDSCAIEGLGRLYHMKFTSGEPPDSDSRSEEIGEGIPMSPQISVTVTGDFVVTIGGSRGELIVEKLEGPTGFKKLIYWKEKKLY